MSWQSTAPHGGHNAVNDNAFAAVPLVTGNARARRMLEHLPDGRLQLGGHLVVTVRERRTDVAFGERRHDLRRDARRVVAAQFHRHRLRISHHHFLPDAAG